MSETSQIPFSDDARFQRALDFVLAHEGGFADDPDDPGGATNFGISLRLARDLGVLDRASSLDLDLDRDGDVDAADIKALTRADAARLYYAVYWLNEGYYRLPLPVAYKIMDLAVNMGPAQAHRLTQRALRSCGFVLKEDGVLGEHTKGALVDCKPPEFLAALRSEAAGFYRLLAATRPAAAKYLPGWLARAYA
jgi:lysozyme family protein